MKVDFSSGEAQVIAPSTPSAGNPDVDFDYDIEAIDYDYFCKNKPIVTFITATNWKSSTVGSRHDDSITTNVIQEPSCDNGMVAVLSSADINTSGGGMDGWDITGDFEFEFQTSPYNELYTEYPEGCASRLGWKPGPYPCSGPDCYQGESKDNFCTFEEWEVIDQGTGGYPQWVIDTLTRMYPEDTNPGKLYGGDQNGEGQYKVLTWKINAKGYSCDPLKTNDYCVDVFNEVSQEFEQKCYDYNEYKSLDGDCQQYKDDQKCEKTGSSCAEGWYDTQTSICYMFTDDYRCDVSNPIEITKTTTKNVCASMLPCMGNDCNIGDDEASDDFEKAVLMGSIAQTVDDDSSCVGQDPNTCEIFPGEEEYCSWELSGMGNNCCESPGGVNYLELASLGYNMMQTETFKTFSSSLGSYVPEAIGGMYTDFSKMIETGWNAGTKVVVDFTSSIMGDPDVVANASKTVASGSATASEAVSTMITAMQQNVYSFINGAIPEELAGMLFQEVTQDMISDKTKDFAANQAGDLAMSEMANTIMSIVSFVGLIYTIYNVVKLLANLLTQCDENEQDMGVKLAQRQCFKVGDKYCAKDVLGVCYLRRQNFCCFSSVLSRIIADQGSKQIGKDMAGCPGFTIAEFGTIDFDKLDLSEWLSTMYESDILSTSGYDIERLTGTGRIYGNMNCAESNDPECVDSERKNANERAEEQFSDGMSEDVNQIKNTFSPEQVDCSIYPRPLMCEMGG